MDSTVCPGRRARSENSGVILNPSRLGSADPDGSKRPRESRVASKATDVNTRAADVVAQSTGQTPKRKKDPAAVARGRLGGQARARNTPPLVRSQDAREAVNTRWAVEKSSQEAPVRS